MFRQFGRAHCRILLHLQAEITILERKLDVLDKHDAESSEHMFRLRQSSWKEGWDPEQKNLLDELKMRLLEYGESYLESKWVSKILITVKMSS